MGVNRRNKYLERFSIRYTSIQKDDAVTGSMHIVEACGLKIILDMGIYQDNSMNIIDKYRLNSHVFKYDYSDVDYVLVSHLHSDHVSALPVLSQQQTNFNGIVMATELTAKMTVLNNSDSAFLMQSETSSWNALHPSEKVFPLYTQEDVDNLQIREYDYNRKIRLNDNVYITFLPNSHVCGASSIYITVEDGNKIVDSLLYTGDIQYKKGDNKPFTMKWNSERLIVHNLVIESTYAGEKQEKYNPIDELEAHILNSIRNNRPLLLGTFAFHRSSEILYYLFKIWERNAEIRNADYPIYVAGNLMYKAHTELGKKYCENFFDEEWKSTGLWQWQKPIFLRTFKDVDTRLSKPTTCLMIATSGMLDKAYSKYLCTKHLGNKKVDILVSGYCAEGTIGRKLLDGEKEIIIDGKMYRVRANVIGAMRLSGHADSVGMCDFIKECIYLNKLKNVFLVHGNIDRKEKQIELYKQFLNDKTNIEIPKRYKHFKV